MVNNNINEILSKLLSDQDVAGNIGGLLSGYQNQNKMGNSGAMDLNSYMTPSFQGFRFAKGGIPGDPDPIRDRTTSEGERIIEELGMDMNAYRKYRDLVIHHETGGTFDPKQKQLNNGPGRGLFQFEAPSVKTSVERLKTYYKNKGKEVPEWINDDVDVLNLNAEQQEILFAGQMMSKNNVYKKDKDGKSVPSGEYKIDLDKTFKRDDWKLDDFTDAWITNHNRTSGDSREDRIKKFTDDSNTILDKAGSILPIGQNVVPFTDKNAMMDTLNAPSANEALGIPQAGLGKFFKNRWNDIKKVGEGAFEAAKGSADWTLGLVGAGDVIQDTWVDRSKFLSGTNNVIGGVARGALDFAVPGAGTALGTMGGSLNGAVNNGREQKASEQQQVQFNDSAAGGMQELMQILGGGINGMGGQNPMASLATLFGGSFDNGGIVEAVPEGLEAIQTEKYKGRSEMIILPDGMISKVNAKTSHEKMKEDEVTDVVPANSYVASARPEMKFERKSLEEIIFGYKSLPYEEHTKGIIPEKVTAADIVPKNKKKFTPAEYVEFIQNKFPVVKNDDPFSNSANTENMNSRVPFIQVAIQGGEEQRMMSEQGQFKYGGYVTPRKMFNGGGIGAALGVVGGLTTGISQLVNVSAQRKELKNQQGQLETLSNDLLGINNASVAAGIAGQLAQETNLPKLNLDYSRLENFNTGTPQSFIEQQGRPTMDITAMIDRMGDRGGIAALANASSASMDARNQAAQNAYSQQRNADFNIASTITQGKNEENQYNNNLRMQEIAARNNVFNNIAGQVQGGLQNEANIKANKFSVNSSLASQRAALRGQGAAAFGNTLTGIGGILTSSGGELSSLFGSNGPGIGVGPAATMSREEIINSFNMPQNTINVPQPTPINMTAPYINPNYTPPVFGQSVIGAGFPSPGGLSTYVPQSIPGSISTYTLNDFNFAGMRPR